jgi:hypothetical protein
MTTTKSPRSLARGFEGPPLAAPAARRPFAGSASSWRPKPWREARSAERQWRRPAAAARRSP